MIILPIGTRSSIAFKPKLTITLIAVNIFIAALSFISTDRDEAALFDLQKKRLSRQVYLYALEKLGKGFIPAATSLDGEVIEAIEHKTFPNVLGVQFHPEASRIWKGIDYKHTLGDEGRPILAVLEANPPSVLFHKLLWTWFTTQIYKYHDANSL